LSASLLGDELENRRNQLRATLPIRRVVGPADVAALAVHIMTNTALTGATYDVDGGQQLVLRKTPSMSSMGITICGGVFKAKALCAGKLPHPFRF